MSEDESPQRPRSVVLSELRELVKRDTADDPETQAAWLARIDELESKGDGR